MKIEKLKIKLLDKDNNEIVYRISLWQTMKLSFNGCLGWYILYIITINLIHLIFE